MAKAVTVENYRQDPLFPRISKAVADILASGKVVAPADVLVRMGLLKPEHLDDWRYGRVPYLERVVICNLSRLSRLLRILRLLAHDLNLKPSGTVYKKWGKGARHRPRFTKTGDPAVEDAYSRHFVWPGKGPFHAPVYEQVRQEKTDATCVSGVVPQRTADGTMGAGLEAVARSWMQRVWAQRDVEAIDELHAPEFVDHSSAGRGTDRNAYRAGVAELFAAFPDWTAITEELVVDVTTNKVAIRWSAVGSHRGEFLGMVPTGRRVTFRGIEILSVRTGKVVERWGEWDGLDLMEQLRGRGSGSA